MSSPIVRHRVDRCPGVLRPWPAEDGLLIRLRLVGGRIRVSQLRALAAVSEDYGDGRIHLTVRANLQLRALPGRNGQLPAGVVGAVEATGLLPSRTHELVRNIMVSPQSGLDATTADLRPAAAQLDRALQTRPRLAGLPGRFLFVLDDGHGDLLGHPCDLGAVALDRHSAQLRIGETWGPSLSLADVPDALLDLAGAFLDVRGDGRTAAWHVADLPGQLRAPEAPRAGLPHPSGPLPFGEVPGGHHLAIPDGVLTAELLDRLEALATSDLVVTPWHGVLIPGGER